MKLFLIGMPKSGTSTLQTALIRSGLRSAHWKDQKIGFVGKVIYRSYFNGSDPLIEFSDFDAITQADVNINGVVFWPQCDFALLECIRSYHPNCKFVLNYRDPLATARSMIKWTDFAERLKEASIPGLPKGFGGHEKELERWIEGHFSALRKHFQSDPNFFEYDIADPSAPEIIGRHIDTEIKWWGVANKNDENNPVSQIWRDKNIEVS